MAVKENEPPAGAPDWIVTFADMISLLVTFFILLMTFSSLDSYDSFKVDGNILGTTGTLSSSGGEQAIDPPAMDVMSAMDAKRGADTPHSRPASELLEQVSEIGMKDTDEHVEIDLAAVKDGLVIRYDDRAAFAPGSTALSPYLKTAVGELARVLEHYAFTIVIEGHTDDQFKNTRQHGTPEELAAARAIAVVDEMLASSKLSPLRLMTVGHGDANPVATNDTPEGRRSNRRIEIRVMSLSENRAAAVKQVARSDG